MPLADREPLSAMAKDLVRRRVAEGQYPAESKVAIGHVAQDLGISPTPVREALVQLVGEGFLSLLPNRGFYVQPLTVREVTELYPIAATLEDRALQSVPQLTPPRVRKLMALNERVRGAAHKSPERTIRLNQEWHRLLLEPCDNAELHRLIAHLRSRTFRYEFVCYSFQQDELDVQLDMHAEIVAAHARGDQRQSRAALRRHWAGNLELVVKAGAELFGQ